MIKNFDSTIIKKFINKVMLIFIFYTIAAASFNGFFTKWAFCDSDNRFSFEMMYDETAYRPFIHRQLMFSIAKEIKSVIPEEKQEKFISHLERHNFIAESYKRAQISQRYMIEYYLVYFMTFIFLFLSMFIWKEIGINVTGNLTAGIISACVFAIIFPILETVGGFFYDFGEIFFISLAILLAIKGNWIAILFISPIAAYNKESFLFFLATLFPFLAAKIGNKKTFLITTAAMFFSGLVYLYVKSMYVGNDGGTTEFHLFKHLEYIFRSWINTEITYGVFYGAGMFIPHILLIAWIFKVTWKKLSKEWQTHIKIAAAINFPLYILFCNPGELRNLSLMYMGFIAMLSIFIKEAICIEQKK